MSFRLRLVLAFAGLAIILAFSFTVLSEALLRHGLETEANERLALLGSLFGQDLPASTWPPPHRPSKAAKTALSQAVRDFNAQHQLNRTVLLLPDGSALDSDHEAQGLATDWWAIDGLNQPTQLTGTARVAAALFKSDEGAWVKTLYLKVDPLKNLWLRMEAGTRLLGQVSLLQNRLFKLAMALGFPALLAGIFMAWSLSRRARQLSEKLQGSPVGIDLPGNDEFSQVARAMDRVLKDLEKERSEKEKLGQAKLEQAKSLSWGVAHELRNPLAGLTLLCDLLKRKVDQGANLHEAVEIGARIQKEVLRLEKTVADFLEFARTPDLVLKTIKLEEAAGTLAQGLDPRPVISGSATVLADSKALNVILGVLLANAYEAAGSHAGALVTVSIHSYKDSVSLKVHDSGPPVPGGERSKLFTPFFTTKAKGMGLGLASAASLADAMGGSLVLDDDGKTFVLKLPQSKEQVVF